MGVRDLTEICGCESDGLGAKIGEGDAEAEIGFQKIYGDGCAW